MSDTFEYSPKDHGFIYRFADGRVSLPHSVFLPAPFAALPTRVLRSIGATVQAYRKVDLALVRLADRAAGRKPYAWGTPAQLPPVAYPVPDPSSLPRSGEGGEPVRETSWSPPEPDTPEEAAARAMRLAAFDQKRRELEARDKTGASPQRQDQIMRYAPATGHAPFAALPFEAIHDPDRADRLARFDRMRQEIEARQPRQPRQGRHWRQSL